MRTPADSRKFKRSIETHRKESQVCKEPSSTNARSRNEPYSKQAKHGQPRKKPSTPACLNPPQE